MKLKNLGYAALIAVSAVVIAIGSAAPGQAKAKKKAAAAPAPMSAFCLQPQKPVCGVKGGQKFTYASSCYAQKDGAKVVSQKACPVHKAKKAMKAKKKMAKPAAKPAAKPMKKAAAPAKKAAKK
jgi:DnaK suppressor protein